MKLYKDGITVNVPESDMNFYIGAGYKKVDQGHEEKKPKQKRLTPEEKAASQAEQDFQNNPDVDGEEVNDG